MTTSPAVIMLAMILLAAASRADDFHGYAPTPPMGWNSWDCFGTTVTEAQIRQQADFMAAHLQAHGWNYIVVDIQWYEPNSKGHDYKPGARLAMDEFSRLVPAPEKFPSAINGRGFKPVRGELLIQASDHRSLLDSFLPTGTRTVPKTVPNGVLGAYSRCTARLFLAYYGQKC